MTDIAYIMNMLPAKYDFDRMVDHGHMSFTYEEFLAHNERIIRELPSDDLAFLRRLCGIIKTSAMNLMDMESCVEFRADGIYYNREGELCIFNPR
jgi:hypothetical protein